jgi:hypothetical protein
VALGGASVLLLGGLLGLAWWSWHRKSGREPATRFRPIRVGLAAGALALIAVGAVWRLVVAIQSTPACSPPPGVQSRAIGHPLDLPLVAEKASTWPETGLAMLYAREIGAPVCRSVRADYYVGVHDSDFSWGRTLTVGDIVLSPPDTTPVESMADVADHEARYRPQWAVGTVIGGPFAFPVAYAVDDFFFPGARNHFERQAGLELGGYSYAGYGPVLGPAQIAVLCAVPAVIVVAMLARQRRWRIRRPFRIGARKRR